jgi:peptide/nickel transport system substrate-binding protein
MAVFKAQARTSFLALALILLAQGCVPAQPSQSPDRSSVQTVTSAPGAPKRVVLGILQEPRTWAPWETTTTAGGANQVAFLIKRSLTTLDQQGSLQPDLAASLPSLDRGDWRVEPDGTMEQTWKLDPNAKWHDGRQVTSDDFVFGWEVETDASLPRSISPAPGLISGVTAPDPQTVVIRFKSSSPLAGQALYFPFPRHVLGEALSAGVGERFINHEYWTSAFVGAGPYRVAEWQPGAHLELESFPDYVRGRPKIDTVVVRFLGDANTLYANVLSGGVDMALPDGLSVDHALELQRTWAAPGTGNHAVTYNDGRFYFMEFQHRAEWARPSTARDPRVRRAFYHTVDKDGVNEVENAGLGFLADSWITPDDPRRSRFQDSIPEWSQDVGLAQRILEEAGWRRGSDGVLVHTSGERMESEIRVTAGQGHIRAMAVMAEGWRRVGAVVSEVPIPAAMVSNQEYRSTFPFAGLSGYPLRYFEWESWRFSCATASMADTRWNGHRDGYCNRTAEPLIERLQNTLREEDRTTLQAQIMRIILKEDYAGPPLYWQVSPLVWEKGLTGPGPLKLGQYGSPYSAMHIHTWDRT